MVMGKFRHELNQVMNLRRAKTEKRTSLQTNQLKMQERLDEHFIVLAVSLNFQSATMYGAHYRGSIDLFLFLGTSNRRARGQKSEI